MRAAFLVVLCSLLPGVATVHCLVEGLDRCPEEAWNRCAQSVGIFGDASQLGDDVPHYPRKSWIMKPDFIESLYIQVVIRCNKSMERRPASGQKEKLSQGCTWNKDQSCDCNNPSHHSYHSDEGLKIRRGFPFFIFKITHLVNYEKCCNFPLPGQYCNGHYQRWSILA